MCSLIKELQQSIQSQKPLLDRFEKNVAALEELCDEEDALQLDKIAEGLEQRYEEVRDAVRNRALALESAIEHSSQFTDRLDVILAKLGGAAVQVNSKCLLDIFLEVNQLIKPVLFSQRQ